MEYGYHGGGVWLGRIKRRRKGITSTTFEPKNTFTCLLCEGMPSNGTLSFCDISIGYKKMIKLFLIFQKIRKEVSGFSTKAVIDAYILLAEYKT